MSKKDVYIFGSTDPAKTASFYKALGIPLAPQSAGVTKHFIGDLEGSEMHIVPSESPAVPKSPEHIVLAVRVPSLYLVFSRLHGSGFVTAVKNRRLHKDDTHDTATIQDPEGRTIYLIEDPKFLAKKKPSPP